MRRGRRYRLRKLEANLALYLHNLDLSKLGHKFVLAIVVPLESNS